MKDRRITEAEYDRLPAKNKVEVLEAALDIMEQYNGRSKEACIRIATEDYYNDKKRKK